jgi:hypothetical protein
MSFYAGNIEGALSAWIGNIALPESNRSCFDRLSRFLDQYSRSDEGTPEDRENLTKRVLLEVFEKHYAVDGDRNVEHAILLELFVDNRWKVLFEKPETARAFVFIATRFVETNMRSIPNYAVTVLRRFCRAMSGRNDGGVQDADITLRSIAASLFGEPWCAVIYDTRNSGESLSDLIKSTAPEFVNGVLSADNGRQDVTLPDMSNSV